VTLTGRPTIAAAESARFTTNVRCPARIGHNGAVEYWKPHSLATPHEGQLDLKIGDQVQTIVDLRGVPEGTQGKILLANGFNWQRYRVLFANGAEVGDLDQRHIEPIGRAAKRVAKRAKADARRT
jgi:hypothetical protein